jgi:hypothetical protein
VNVPGYISDREEYMVVRGGRNGAYRFYITDREMNILQGLFPFDTVGLSGFERFYMTQVDTVVGSGDDGAFLNLQKEDTLYRITKRGAVPEAILYKGRYRLPAEPLVIMFNQGDVEPGVFKYISGVTVRTIGDYYLMEYVMIAGQASQIWNRSERRLVAHSDSRDGLDKHGLKILVPLPGGGTLTAKRPEFFIGEDRIGLVVNALDAVGAIEGVKETDNPIIVIATLKK